MPVFTATGGAHANKNFDIVACISPGLRLETMMLRRQFHLEPFHINPSPTLQPGPIPFALVLLDLRLHLFLFQVVMPILYTAPTLFFHIHLVLYPAAREELAVAHLS